MSRINQNFVPSHYDDFYKGNKKTTEPSRQSIHLKKSVPSLGKEVFNYLKEKAPSIKDAPSPSQTKKISCRNAADQAADRILKNSTYTVDDSLNVELTIHFNQNDIIRGPKGLPQRLQEINLRFNGLCELICNKVLIDDLLGKGGGDFLKEKLTVSELNKDSIAKSHILNVYSIFHRMVAFLFGIYPDNIFSITDQWNLIVKDKNRNKVNKELLFKGLDKIKDGTVLKLEVFRKTTTLFTGHSLLIKKINENEFIFFDPNTGEHRGLSKEDLIEKINGQIHNRNATDIFFSKGHSYLKRLKDKKILKVANQKI